MRKRRLRYWKNHSQNFETMKNKKLLLLTEKDIQQKISRIAYEILENNYEEKELIIAGIKDNGYNFAKKIVNALKKISPFKLTLTSISINKVKPLSEEVIIDLKKEELNNKTVIIIDDVANTGRTLFYALKPLMNFSPKNVQICVMVDRKHKKFPVSADYIGISLSTTMKEHISVEIESVKEEGVYLL